MISRITVGFKSNEYLPDRIKKFFTNKGIKNLDNPDFGNYRNAKILGWGFQNSHTYKKYLHLLFKDSHFYPKSILINKNWVSQNKSKTNEFINNEKCIVKYDKGKSGKDIFIVKNANEIINKINNEFWILQKIIEPVLFNENKFDLRIYHFILRYGNSYYNILSKVGYVKTSIHKYDKDSSSPYGFLTNRTFNNSKRKQHMFDFFDFINNFEKNEQKRKNTILKIYNIIREYSAILVKNYKPNNLTAQMMIYGPDIILDKNLNPYLLETNCSPGIFIQSKTIANKQKLMLEELMENIITPILQKNINLEEYVGKLLFIEKIV